MIMYTDYVTEVTNPQATLDATRDGAAKAVDGSVLREEKITLNGCPGIEFEVSGKGYRALVRHYFVGRRLYQVMFIQPLSSDLALGSKNASKAFSSFEVAPK
jgi:hypothetical protein